MRGLTSNRPYDVILNGRIYSNEINLSVICGQKYSNAFYSFLSQLQTKHFTGDYRVSQAYAGGLLHRESG